MLFKKHNLLCIILFISISVGAQVKTVSPGKDFEAIKVSTGLFVEIITNSEENKIDVKGTERDKVTIEVNKGELQLSLPVGQLFTEAEILVTVYAKEVEELKVRSGSEVEFISVVNQKKISLIASEGSYIGGELQVDKLTVKSVTGASISLFGTVKNSSVVVKTGGGFDGENLKTEITNVSLSFGGEANVYVTENCSANINAGGNIHVYGNPTTISQKVKLGGNIKLIE